MLAPLKDRRVIERDDDADHPPTQPLPLSDLQAENLGLRLALREARREQRQGALRASRQIVALNNEISRLQNVNEELRQQCAEYASGQTIVSLGQRLMTLEENNAQLLAAAQQVWYLDRTLGAAVGECERLARQRDAAISSLRGDPTPRRN